MSKESDYEEMRGEEEWGTERKEGMRGKGIGRVDEKK